MSDSDNSEDDLKLQLEFGQSCSPLGFGLVVKTTPTTQKLIPSPTPVLVRKDHLLSQLKKKVDGFPCDEMTFNEVSELISDIFSKRGSPSGLR